MGLITGKVTNNKTGEPIWNAEVFLSDDKGNITNPPVGSVMSMIPSLAPLQVTFVFVTVALRMSG